MIILERLSITRFKGVRGVALDFPERGATLIEGNNEAGKSTLFEAIHFAMYGRTLTGTLADAIPHDAEDAEVSVRLRIEHPGRQPDILDIARTITTVGAQTSSGVRLRVERGGTEAEEIKRVSDANRRIALELGGLTADTFVNSCFVPQKQLAGLEMLDRSQREAAVASLLNLDRLTRAAQGLSVRPVDTEEVRRHDARVALAEATEALASIEARQTTAEANLHRFAFLDSLVAVEAASRRAQTATTDAIGARARRDHALVIVDRHATLMNASEAWRAVAVVARYANDARAAARRSRARASEATAAQNSLPDAETHLERLRGIEARVTAVTTWLVEGRPALRQEVAAIDARRLARARANAELRAAEDVLRDLDRQLQSVAVRREELLPLIAAREASRARRTALDALRVAVAGREDCLRDAETASLAVAARLDADARLASARERLAEASARVALLDRDRAAVAQRDHLLRIRATLAGAIDAREAHAQARARNDRLRELTLGVVEASPSASGHLALQLQIDHPLTGARVIDLMLNRDGDVLASSRDATDEEIRRVQNSEVPTLAPADLNALDADAVRARDALAPLGEVPPSTTRGARDRLAQLDAILAEPTPTLDAAEYSEATTACTRATVETQVHQTAADSMGTLTALEFRAAEANAAVTAASQTVTRTAFDLGLALPDEHQFALWVIDGARREVDEALEATAAAAGGLEAANEEATRLEGQRTPAIARADTARRDLAGDDDAELNRQEETARTSGRAGDEHASVEWREAQAEARLLLFAVPESGTAALPSRDTVLGFTDAVRHALRLASDEVTRLRARSDDARSASGDAALDADRERRANDALDQSVSAAREASSRANNDVSRDTDRHVLKAIRDAATVEDGFNQRRHGEAPDDLATEDVAVKVADAYATASHVLDVDEARRTVVDAEDAERDADRAGAAARADADTAWRAAIDAGMSLGLEIGARPDDPQMEIIRLRELVTGTGDIEPDRETATATWRAVLAEVGAVSEAIAVARRTVGAEDPLTVSEARTRRDAARLALRARERAVTILASTRARMMAAILPDTQREMARILPDLTAGRYRFPRLDDRFQLEVYDGRKRAWVRRSLFSGGTQDQFSLALRLGFAIAALPRELGTAPGFLFLDEPLSSFDRERTRALVDLLRDPAGLIGTHFRQVFLISHSQAFDPGLFTYQIQMEDGGIARTNLPSATSSAIPERRPTIGPN